MATAGVIYMSYPLFTVVLAKLWLGQPMTGRGVIAGLLVVAAAAVALSPGAVPADALLPLLMSLPAPICFAVIIVVLSALVPALSVPERLACGMLGAVMGLLPVKLAGDLDRAVPSSGDGWLAILAMAGLTATLPQLLYTLPIRLSPTPTICSVSPWTAGKGRRRRIEEAIRLILDCSENRTGV